MDVIRPSKVSPGACLSMGFCAKANVKHDLSFCKTNMPDTALLLFLWLAEGRLVATLELAQRQCLMNRRAKQQKTVALMEASHLVLLGTIRLGGQTSASSPLREEITCNGDTRCHRGAGEFRLKAGRHAIALLTTSSNSQPVLARFPGFEVGLPGGYQGPAWLFNDARPRPLGFLQL